MGFVELAAAVKFLNGADLSLGWGIFTRNVCLAIWIAIFGLTGLYLVGLFRLPEGHAAAEDRRDPAPASRSPSSRSRSTCSTGLNGKPLGEVRRGMAAADRGAVRPRSGIRRASAPWPSGRLGRRFEDDYEGALAEAKTAGPAALHRLHGLQLRELPGGRGDDLQAATRRSGSCSRASSCVELHLDGGRCRGQESRAASTKLGLRNRRMPAYVVLDPTMTVHQQLGLAERRSGAVEAAGQGRSAAVEDPEALSPAGGTITEHRSAWDGRVLGQVALGGPAEVEQAIQTARRRARRVRRGLDGPPQRDPRARLGRARAAPKEEIARLIALEVAKPIALARIEAERAAVDVPRRLARRRDDRGRDRPARPPRRARGQGGAGPRVSRRASSPRSRRSTSRSTSSRTKSRRRSRPDAR